jgi:hypothetical protein
LWDFVRTGGQAAGRQLSTSPTLPRAVVGTVSFASIVVSFPAGRTTTVRRPTSKPS